MLRLAGRAMAQLTVQRLFSAQLILHFAAMAAGLVSRFEVVVRVMDLVRSTLLPVVLAFDRSFTRGLKGIHIGEGTFAELWNSDQGTNAESCTAGAPRSFEDL